MTKKKNKDLTEYITFYHQCPKSGFISRKSEKLSRFSSTVPLTKYFLGYNGRKTMILAPMSSTTLRVDYYHHVSAVLCCIYEGSYYEKDFSYERTLKSVEIAIYSINPVTEKETKETIYYNIILSESDYEEYKDINEVRELVKMFPILDDEKMSRLSCFNSLKDAFDNHVLGSGDDKGNNEVLFIEINIRDTEGNLCFVTEEDDN